MAGWYPERESSGFGRSHQFIRERSVKVPGFLFPYHRVCRYHPNSQRILESVTYLLPLLQTPGQCYGSRTCDVGLLPPNASRRYWCTRSYSPSSRVLKMSEWFPFRLFLVQRRQERRTMRRCCGKTDRKGGIRGGEVPTGALNEIGIFFWSSRAVYQRCWSGSESSRG